MLKRLFCCLILIVFLVPLCQANTLSLSEAVGLARQNNPELAAAKFAWEAAKVKVSQTLSLADPKLGLESEQIPSGSRNLEDGMKMYTAEQMIMFPGKIYAEWQMAQAESAISEAKYNAKTLEIFAQVKSAYYDLFYTDRALKVLADIKELLLGIKKSAEVKYIVGQAVQADVLMANIEYLVMDNDLTTMKQEQGVKAAKLKALLNRSGLVTIETEATLNLPVTIEPNSVLENRALVNRPELKAMKAELAAKDSSHLKSKMDYFPDTSLGVKKRVAGGWDAMISLSVPLYFWKQGAGVAALGLERQVAEESLNNMVNLTRWEIREAWVMADAARRTMKLYETSILPQSTAALKGMLAAYQSKKVDFQALLQIERTYRDTKLKYLESQVAYGKALAELERLTGQSFE